jgi:hypothetical protein
MALAVIATTLFVASCGSSNNGAPVNNQGYSASNLSGTYVFSSLGSDSTNGLFLAAVGTVTANGTGGITGGMIDVNGFSLTGGPFSTAITSGTYSVSSDGRGTATIQYSGGSSTFDFVLTSTAGGLVTEFDGNGTGSGTLDLQTTGSLTGAYSFGLTGASVSGQNEVPLAAVGTFDVSASKPQGEPTNGLIDINSNGTAPGGTAGLTLSATVTAGSPGTALLVAQNGTTYNFHVYMVDDTHLKFIETDTAQILAGDAFTQQTSIPNGIYAYAMDGLDNSDAPLAVAGFITAGSSNAISAGLEDYNDAGTTGQVSGFGGSYTSFSGGRTELTLNGIYNGVSGTNSDVTFAAYPSSGGIELLEIDNGGITGGIALPQGSATSLGTSQGYGLNISAINAGNGSGSFEEDDIAEIVTSSSGSSFTGVEDINDEGTTTFGTAFDGNLTTNSAAPGYGSAASTSSGTNLVNFNYYLANNGATALILETDDYQLGTGIIEQQASAQSSAQSRPAAAHSHFSIVPLKAGARAAWKNRNK